MSSANLGWGLGGSCYSPNAHPSCWWDVLRGNKGEVPLKFFLEFALGMETTETTHCQVGFRTHLCLWDYPLCSWDYVLSGKNEILNQHEQIHNMECVSVGTNQSNCMWKLWKSQLLYILLANWSFMFNSVQDLLFSKVGGSTYIIFFFLTYLYKLYDTKHIAQEHIN
jgi:hypothetical protein